MMLQPHPHPLPLRMRIKARAAPGLDGPTAHSLRRLSERKLHSPRCSLVKAILIQNALPLLNRYDAELLPAHHVASREEEELEEDDATMLALDEELSETTPTASTVTAALPMSLFPPSAASAAEAQNGDHASDAPVASSRAPAPASGRPRLLSRSRRFHPHARPVDLDHDVNVDLGAGDSSDSDEGDGTVFSAGPTAAPFDEFDDVFDILDPRPLVAPNEARSASLPSSPSASASVSMPRLAKRPSSCCSFASSSSMDEEPDEGGCEAKRAKLPPATATAAAGSAASSCSADHLTSTRQPLPALACV
jgi:hypothetical protein